MRVSACLSAYARARTFVCMPAGIERPDARPHIQRRVLQVLGTCARDVQQLCLHALQLVVGVAVEDFGKLLLDVGRRAEKRGMVLLLRHDGGGNLAREPGGERPAFEGVRSLSGQGRRAVLLARFRRRGSATAAGHAAGQHLLHWDKRTTTATLAPRLWLATEAVSAAPGSRRAASSSTNRTAPAASPTCAGLAGWTLCWRLASSSGHHGRGRTRSRETSMALLRLASGRRAALGAGLRSSARDGARGSSAGRAPAPPAGASAARRCVLRANAARPGAGGIGRGGAEGTLPLTQRQGRSVG